MKDTFYFSHDYNARNDTKIKKLIAKHGFTGYGLFWAIIEELYNNDNCLTTDYEIVLSDRKAKPSLIKSIVEDFSLFIIKDDRFYSPSIESRLTDRLNKSGKARDSGKAKWKHANQDPNTKKRSERLSEARKKGTHLKQEWENMKTFFNECVRCNSINEIVKDHIIPIYQGGSDSILNIQPLCKKCNSSKGAENKDYRLEWCNKNACEMPADFLEMPAIKERKGKDKKGKERIVTDVVPFDKSKGCYQECISLYNQFLIDRTGAGVKMNGREGKSMNTIIEHLSRQDKIAGDKQKIIDAWNYILVNWDSLTTYHKNRVKLSNIDEDLSNILLQLKQKNNTPPNESTAEKFRDLIRSQSTGSVQQPNTVNDVFSSTQNGDGTQ